MLRRLKELAEQKVSFAFETTLASKTFAPWISSLQNTGYKFHLVYLWLPSDNMALARVASRVKMGGHAVPADTIMRRYQAGLQNFFAFIAHWLIHGESITLPKKLWISSLMVRRNGL